MFVDCGPDWRLDRSDQRDPFAPPVRAAQAEATPPVAVPFVLRGVVLAPTPAALVADADGRSRLVRVGDRLGVWVVMRVDPQGLLVAEVAPDEQPGRQTREQFLPLGTRALPQVAHRGGR